MIDSKTVQEVQKELIAAVHRGHEQVRKGQERVRKSQAQVRKNRETIAGVVSELAKAVRSAAPAGPTVHIPSPAETRAHAREIASHAITVQRDLAGKAWQAAGPYAERVRTTQRDLTEMARHTVPYAERFLAAQRDLADRARRAGVAEQVAAAQRTLTERVTEAARVAAPFVTEGRARLSHLVGTRPEASKPESTAGGAGEAALTEVGKPVVENSQATPAKPELKAKTEPRTRTAKPKATTAKASAAKGGTARATGASKPRTPKQ